jgi:NTP pyrophosphatase (non-canonical NTP hydrolase)
MPNHGGLHEDEIERGARVVEELAATGRLHINDYEKWVHEIWVDSGEQLNPSLARDYEQLRGLFVAAVGCPGELGELLEPIKKAIRKRVTVDQIPEYLGPDGRKHVANEIGDVLYYLARIARTCGLTLQDAMEANVEKLVVRYAAHKPGELPRR